MSNGCATSLDRYPDPDMWSSPIDCTFEQHVGFTRWMIPAHQGSSTVAARLMVTAHLEAPRLHLRIRTGGWSDLTYIAVGWRSGGNFHKARIKHPPFDSWFDVELRSDDRLFALENDRFDQAPIESVRIVVKGEETSDTYVDISPVSLTEATRWAIPTVSTTRTVMEQFLLREESSYPTATELADQILEGVYQLSGCPSIGPVSIDEAASASRLNTYRFRWHALEPVMILVHAYRRHALDRYLDAAWHQALTWIDRFSDPRSARSKYEWYDHGVAMRGLALAALAHVSSPADTTKEHPWDVLASELAATARLLANEAFVARNQPHRVHNHAIFQAVALLAISDTIVAPDSTAWRSTADARLLEQFGHLVLEDGATSENSFGYQHATRELCEFSAKVTTGESGAALSSIAGRMAAFEHALRYPDGTAPAYGDTVSDYPATSVDASPNGFADRVFPASGYASLRYVSPSFRAQVNVYASARSHTHKHADNGAITLWIDGREWLIDPGMYAYGVDDPFGLHYRSAAAHNTVELTGAGPFDFGPNPTSISGMQLNGDEPIVSVRNRGYPDAEVERTIRWNRQTQTIQVTDLVEGAAGVSATARFHFGPDISVVADRRQIEGTAPDGATLRILVQSGALDVELSRGQTDPTVSGWRYLGALRKEPTITAHVGVDPDLNRLECLIELPTPTNESAPRRG